MAEEEGFEPSHPVTSLRAFQARPFSRLGIPPNRLILYLKIIYLSLKKLYIFIVGLNMKEILITNLNKGQRADKFVRKYLNDAPLSFIYKLFRIKDVKVNDKRIEASYILKEGDVIKIYVSDQQLADFSKPRTIVKSSVNLKVIYDDQNLLIVNKPSGLLIHGDEKEKRITLTNIVLNYLYEKGEYNPSDSAGFIPAPCHRLDRNTSGIVVYAKNLPSLQQMEALFKEKTQLKKEYLCLVVGKLYGKGKIDAPLFKDEKKNTVMIKDKAHGGKNALTYYQAKEVYRNCTLVDVNIVTGRTHQIRVHFASISHPVLGDSKYGSFTANKNFDAKYKYTGQFLHAYKLSFYEIDGHLSYLSNRIFEIDLPEIEKKIIEDLRREVDAN